MLKAGNSLLICLALLFVFSRAENEAKAQSAPQTGAGEKTNLIPSILNGVSDPHLIFGGEYAAREINTTWGLLDKEARDALQAGNLDLAESKFKEATLEAEKSRAYNPGVVSGLCGLSLLNQKRGNRQEAERLYELAMRTVEGLSGRGSPEFARLIPDLAWLYLENGKPDKAEWVMKDAAHIHKIKHGEYSEEFASCLDNYSAFLKRLGRHNEAFSHESNAAEIRGRNK